MVENGLANRRELSSYSAGSLFYLRLREEAAGLERLAQLGQLFVQAFAAARKDPRISKVAFLSIKVTPNAEIGETRDSNLAYGNEVSLLLNQGLHESRIAVICCAIGEHLIKGLDRDTAVAFWLDIATQADMLVVADRVAGSSGVTGEVVAMHKLGKPVVTIGELLVRE